MAPSIIAVNKSVNSEPLKMAWQSVLAKMKFLSQKVSEADPFELLSNAESEKDMTFEETTLSTAVLGELASSTDTNASTQLNFTPIPDYDINDALSTFFWDELLPPLVVYSISLVLGLVGNSLIIYTVSR